MNIKNQNLSSKKLLPGVYLAKKKDNSIYFRSSFTYKNKHISLGSFLTEADANTAYEEAVALTKDMSITIDSYAICKKAPTLPFSKWVSIINLRDNGFYFKTPIYMKKNYFLYFLNEKTILKFDVDDLFFYSTHTIMQRDGHLFVADYGMQLNIKNRYGIKNFAVEGRDYEFANGDNTDYRYGNVIILNKYYGVTMNVCPTKTIYVTKIHINGDYIVGKYSDEIDAAIAYNKAVDILKSKNITRNYSVNYIEGISSMEYASRYNKLKISRKLLAL